MVIHTTSMSRSATNPRRLVPLCYQTHVSLQAIDQEKVALAESQDKQKADILVSRDMGVNEDTVSV